MIAFDEFLNAAADDDGSSDVVAQSRESEFDGDFFLASAEKFGESRNSAPFPSMIAIFNRQKTGKHFR